MELKSTRQSLTHTIRRATVWAPAAKAAVLFLLPCPLAVALLAALIAGDATLATYTAGSLTALWGGGLLVSRALAGEARYALGERSDPPAIPFKLLSAILTVVGIVFAARAAGHTVPMTAIFALLGTLGHRAFFGRDLRPQRINVTRVEGVDTAAVTFQLKQAWRRLRRLEAAARGIAAPDVQKRLLGITAIGRSIVGEIERDPRDATRARRFLNHYLAETERLALEYARPRRQAPTPALEQNFRALLGEMERRFSEQHRRLIEHDLLELDVDIEVMHTRLKREGLG